MTSISLNSVGLQFALATVSITQTDVPDLTPPAILSLDLSPLSIDTSSAAVEVPFAIQFLEDSSAVSYCRLALTGVNTQITLTGDARTLIEGKRLGSGFLSGSLLFPVRSRQDTYHVNYVQCVNDARLSTSISGSSLISLNISALFVKQVGPGSYFHISFGLSFTRQPHSLFDLVSCSFYLNLILRYPTLN